MTKKVHAWLPSHFSQWHEPSRGGDYLRVIDKCPCCDGERRTIKAKSTMEKWEWDNLPDDLILLGYEDARAPF